MSQADRCGGRARGLARQRLDAFVHLAEPVVAVRKMVYRANQKLPLIALTGSSGFIGRYLSRELSKRGYRIRILLRRPSIVPLESASAVIGDLTKPQNTAEAFKDADAVIHTAALSGSMTGLPEHDFRVINTDATINLARSAQLAGVKLFIFLSSIRAQSGPRADKILTEEDEPKPTDAYGRSKLAAEQGLSTIDIDWVALRLTLTYGPGVSGNIARLMRLALSPYPLPFGGLSAPRSLLSIDNLVAAITCVLAARHPLRRPLIVADPEPLTTPAMIAVMRSSLGRRSGLFPVPASILKALCLAAGGLDIYQRLAEPLVADSSALKRMGWIAPMTTPLGLGRLIETYADQNVK